MLRILRRLLILGVVLGGLFVGGNVVAENAAESRLAAVARDAFGLDATPTVQLDVFPIVTKIISGELPGLTITAEDVTVDDLAIATLVATLRDVRVDGGILGGADLSVTVGEGSVTAEVTQQAINALLKRRGERATVALTPGRARVTATRTFLGRDRKLVATGRVVLRKRTLVFEPDSVTVDGEPPPRALEAEAERQATVEIDLPALPGGFRVNRVDVSDGMLVLTADVSDRRIDLAGEG